MTDIATERRTTIRAERLVIDSPTSNPDGRPGRVVVEDDEFTMVLHHASKGEPGTTFPRTVNGAVAVFLDVDEQGYDSVAVQYGDDSGNLVEPMRCAIEALQTAIDGIEAVNKVTTPSRHI